MVKDGEKPKYGTETRTHGKPCSGAWTPESPYKLWDTLIGFLQEISIVKFVS